MGIIKLIILPMNIACYIRNPTVYDQVKAALVRVGFRPTRFDSEMALLRTVKRSPFDFIIIDIPSSPNVDAGIFPGWEFVAAHVFPAWFCHPYAMANL